MPPTQSGRSAVTDARRPLRLVSCLACDGISEVTGAFELPGPGGTEPYVRTRCLDGHLVVVPAFALEPNA